VIDSSKQRWRVAGGGDEVVLPPSVDWAVALSAEGRERRVVVWVSHTAWALREGGDLPVNAQTPSR